MHYSPVEAMDCEALRALQTERLINMVTRCYNNVPFYRRKLDEMGLSPDDIKSIDDITKLPFTLKTDLRDNYPYGLFAVPREDLVRIHASSGTTGKQTVVGYNAHDIEIWAESAARALVAAGATKSDYVHVAYGYGLFTGGLGLHYGAEHMGATSIPVSSGNTQRQVQILQDFGSDIICCTPSYALYLGETCKENGIDTKKLPLRAGIFGAEAWSDQMRREIEQSLNIEAFDIYGLSEVAGPGVSYDCKNHDGMHVCEDYFYPEVINPDTGEVLPDGEYGELVFTCIGKEALPLMRYRTRDICCLIRGKCSCGRTLVRMSKPKGRTDDMLIIRGVNVFPSQIEHVLLKLGMQPHYLIVVDRVDNLDIIEVRVEMTSEMFSDAVREIEQTERRLSAELHSTLGIAAKVTLVEPKSIARSEGKAIRVVDNRKI